MMITRKYTLKYCFREETGNEFIKSLENIHKSTTTDKYDFKGCFLDKFGNFRADYIHKKNFEDVLFYTEKGYT